MTDEQTADQLADLFWRDGSHQSIRTAIVRALQQARESAFMAHVADQSTRNYCHTASDVSDALCREMEASNIMGSHLWWGEMYRRIGLELCCAFNAGRADALVDQKPPAGHIIDDQGVVRRVLGTVVLTADGCVWAHGGKVYWHEDPHEQSLDNINDDIAFFEEHGTDADGEACGTWEKVSQCYSTREAAEAAKEAK